MYSSFNDIQASITASELLKLLRDNPDYSTTMEFTPEDETRVNGILDAVAELIDGYLRPRYITPYPNVSSVLRDISNTIAVIRIYQLREKYRKELPESMRSDLRSAEEKLVLIRDGKLLLENPKAPGRRQYRTSCRTRVWTEETLEQMP